MIWELLKIHQIRPVFIVCSHTLAVITSLSACQVSVLQVFFFLVRAQAVSLTTFLHIIQTLSWALWYIWKYLKTSHCCISLTSLLLFQSLFLSIWFNSTAVRAVFTHNWSSWVIWVSHAESADVFTVTTFTALLWLCMNTRGTCGKDTFTVIYRQAGRKAP